jgi:SSS family solute:Na+ symporter
MPCGFIFYQRVIIFRKPFNDFRRIAYFITGKPLPAGNRPAFAGFLFGNIVNHLNTIDLVIIVFYLIGMILVGLWFSRKNKSAEQFTKARGTMPGWAIGISLYATFLSSNTFLGVPGKAYGSNWNSLVFSLAMPFSAWIAVRYFVPFYRRIGGISAYSHLEQRFGSWARTYAVVCFLLVQLARIGSIFFGIALSLQALTGYSMIMIMVVTGICIVIYTVLGGIEAVIWTEVLQAVIKTFGGLIILLVIVHEMKGGVGQIAAIGKQFGKFSLGSFAPDFSVSSFWVVFLYGFFMNLKAFGFDQNYVQRYHAASSAKEAARSVWLCVKIYLPVSLLFFIIGTSLFAFYQQHPAWIETVKLQAAAERLPGNASANAIAEMAAKLQSSDYGDKVMPYFIVTRLPAGLVGLIISAILSAAMSTISSGMNAAATVFSEDIYKRHFNPRLNEKNQLRLLYISTTLIGLMGMLCGVAMIGAVSSILDLWWELSGIFAGGMLGLFLLGLISRRTGKMQAAAATIVGILVILWMTLSPHLPDRYAFFRSALHANMITVIGTLAIFLSGVLFTRLKRISTL